MTHRWFDYRFRVQPHHTDYGGIVWHGTYIQWMESARVDCLRALNVRFEDFVQAGYDLPVVDLQLRYRQPLTLGTRGVAKTRLVPTSGVKLTWLYEIHAIDEATEIPSQLCLTGQVLLVPINRTTRKIVRRLPPNLQPMVDALHQYFAD